MRIKPSEGLKEPNSWEETLIQKAKERNVHLRETHLKRLRDFQDLLARSNQRFNLVSRRGGVNRVIFDQIIDSLLVQPLIEILGPEIVLDLGSGGGFPGIPLAILNSGIQFHLLDASYKKTCYLTEVRAALSLQNVQVIHARAEQLREGVGAGRYDLIVARSVADPARLAEWSGPVLKPKGSLVTYTGDSGDVSLQGLLNGWPRETRPLVLRSWDTGARPEKHRRLLLLGEFGRR